MKLGGQGGGGDMGRTERGGKHGQHIFIEFIKLKKIPKRSRYTHPENTPEKESKLAQNRCVHLCLLCHNPQQLHY